MKVLCSFFSLVFYFLYFPFSQLRETIEHEIRDMGLQVTPFTLTKVIQLYETKNSRHSTMIVGCTGSGKTASWRILQSSLSSLCRAGDPNFNIVRVRVGTVKSLAE